MNSIISSNARQLRLPLSRASTVEFNLALANIKQLSDALLALNAVAGRTLGDEHCEALAMQLANLEASADALGERFRAIGLGNAQPQSRNDFDAASATVLPTLDFIDRISEQMSETRTMLRAASRIAEDLDDRETRRLLRTNLSLLVISGWIVNGIRREYAKRARDLAELCFSAVASRRSDAIADSATRH